MSIALRADFGARSMRLAAKRAKKQRRRAEHRLQCGWDALDLGYYSGETSPQLNWEHGRKTLYKAISFRIQSLGFGVVSLSASGFSRVDLITHLRNESILVLGGIFFEAF